MKRKRLNRDGWGFQGFPYYQLRVDCRDFHGWVCLIDLLSGENCYWELPRAGKVAVCGAGMRWMTLVPDGARHILTVKYRPDGHVALWYADIIDHIERDPDGVMAFVDQYLDVIFTPQGDVKLDDLEELRAARRSGELSAGQYGRARLEGLLVRAKYCLFPKKTEKRCARILAHALQMREAPGTYRKNQ